MSPTPQLFTQEHLNEIKTLDSTLELERNPHTPIQTHTQPTATLYYEDRRGLGEDLAPSESSHRVIPHREDPLNF